MSDFSSNFTLVIALFILMYLISDLTLCVARNQVSKVFQNCWREGKLHVFWADLFSLGKKEQVQ